MSKFKYIPPKQTKANTVFYGNQLLSGDIYGRDSFGPYIVKPAYKTDCTGEKHFQVMRLVAHHAHNTWVYVAATNKTDKTLRKILELAQMGKIYLKDYFRDEAYWKNERAIEYKTISGKTAVLRGEKELPQTSRLECLTTRHCKVERSCNTRNMQLKCAAYLMHSYDLYGKKSVYGTGNGLSYREMDYLDGVV